MGESAEASEEMLRYFQAHEALLFMQYKHSAVHKVTSLPIHIKDSTQSMERVNVQQQIRHVTYAKKFASICFDKKGKG